MFRGQRGCNGNGSFIALDTLCGGWLNLTDGDGRLDRLFRGN
jgi:hypothetical protein